MAHFLASLGLWAVVIGQVVTSIGALLAFLQARQNARLAREARNTAAEAKEGLRVYSLRVNGRLEEFIRLASELAQSHHKSPADIIQVKQTADTLLDEAATMNTKIERK